MRRRIAGFSLLVVLLIQSLTSQAAEQRTASFAQAKVNKNGQVELTYDVERQVFVQKEGGETETRTVLERRMSINDFQVVLLRQVNGEKIERGDIAKRLAKLTPVLMLPEDAELNAEHAPLFKPDALILSIVNAEAKPTK